MGREPRVPVAGPVSAVVGAQTATADGDRAGGLGVPYVGRLGRGSLHDEPRSAVAQPQGEVCRRRLLHPIAVYMW